MKYIMLWVIAVTLISCQEIKRQNSKDATGETPYKKTGSIQRIAPGIDDLVPNNASIEILAKGFAWTEGPLWIEDGKYLLFSESPNNRINTWSEEEGVRVYLEPSGYTGNKERGGEPGSNGLLLDNDGRLILCQHGDRRMARMTAPLTHPKSEFETVIATYKGKRLNSPNDAIFDSKGNLFFTDPPYGLEGNVDDPAKELSFQGVYRYSTDGEITLITDQMSRPNGIGLSPDEKTLYVSNSDEEHPIWMAFHLDDKGQVLEQRIFNDASGSKEKGLPDGLKVDKNGNVWATGPGGVWIFNASGVILGKIRTGQATSNCAFDKLEKTLYMTCDNYVMRIRL